MAQEREFLKRILTDPGAKELLKEIESTAGGEETAEKLVSAAKELGFDISKEKFLELVRLKEEEQKRRTESAQSQVKAAIGEKELDTVAGGGEEDECSDTYVIGENCWFNDSCDYVLRLYEAPETVKNECNVQSIAIGLDQNDWVLITEDEGAEREDLFKCKEDYKLNM